MATNVETTATNWQGLGTTAPCSQYRMTVGYRWKDDAGVQQQWGPNTVTFPDFLSALTPAETAYFAEELRELVLRVSRRRAGIDRTVTGGV